MEPRRFVPIVATGVVIRLSLLWAGGKAFEDQIRWFLSHIERYQWWIVGGLFAITFMQSATRNAGRKKRDTLEDLERDLPTEGEPDPNL